MRIALAWLAVWFGPSSCVHAQSIPAYSLLRENEDWSVLRDPGRNIDYLAFWAGYKF
jgi:hypothetical protein